MFIYTILKKTVQIFKRKNDKMINTKDKNPT